MDKDDISYKKKLLDNDEGYNYLLRKNHSLRNAFEQTRFEIINLYSNSDLMTDDQFNRLINLEKEYKHKFLEITKEIAENE